jgi:hypothetical protein
VKETPPLPLPCTQDPTMHFTQVPLHAKMSVGLCACADARVNVCACVRVWRDTCWHIHVLFHQNQLL